MVAASEEAVRMPGNWTSRGRGRCRTCNATIQPRATNRLTFSAQTSFKPARTWAYRPTIIRIYSAQSKPPSHSPTIQKRLGSIVSSLSWCRRAPLHTRKTHLRIHQEKVEQRGKTEGDGVIEGVDEPPVAHDADATRPRAQDIEIGVARSLPLYKNSKCTKEKITKNIIGDAGYRSPYLSHAKRALYHLSYIPFVNIGTTDFICRQKH